MTIISVAYLVIEAEVVKYHSLGNIQGLEYFVGAKLPFNNYIFNRGFAPNMKGKVVDMQINKQVHHFINTPELIVVINFHVTNIHG